MGVMKVRFFTRGFYCRRFAFEQWRGGLEPPDQGTKAWRHPRGVWWSFALPLKSYRVGMLGVNWGITLR